MQQCCGLPTDRLHAWNYLAAINQFLTYSFVHLDDVQIQILIDSDVHYIAQCKLWSELY